MLPFLKKNLFLVVSFVLLFSSFYSNIWKIATDDHYGKFDVLSEVLILGELNSSERNGIFAHSGFAGVHFNESAFPDSVVSSCSYLDLSRVQIVDRAKHTEPDLYLNKKELPDSYCPYLSQIAGQGYLYAVLNKMLPFSNATKYEIFKIINSVLGALCFVLFIAWVNRNFGLISASITFILIFLSHWLVIYFGNGLWWSLWNFYLPFLTMLLLLEKKQSNPNSVSNIKIFSFLFLSVFLKCFFSGYEFITVSLVSIFCPIVYYFWLEKKSFSHFFSFSLKASGIAVVAVFAYMLLLAIQLTDYYGDLDAAIEYISYAYTKRTSAKTHAFMKEPLDTIFYIIRYYYMKGNAFELGFLSLNFRFYFIYLFAIISAFAGFVYFSSKKLANRKYVALLLATSFSVLCPLSWFIVFRDHAASHPHLNFIIWYMPTLLLGFSVIGLGVSIIVSKLKPSNP